MPLASGTGNKVAPSRRAAVFRAAGAVVTLIIAVWGAVTGTIAWRDDRQTAIDVSPAKAVLAVSENNAPILVSIVNRSQHGVVL
jgi:hypothetical protein